MLGGLPYVLVGVLWVTCLREAQLTKVAQIIFICIAAVACRLEFLGVLVALFLLFFVKYRAVKGVEVLYLVGDTNLSVGVSVLF